MDIPVMKMDLDTSKHDAIVRADERNKVLEDIKQAIINRYQPLDEYGADLIEIIESLTPNQKPHGKHTRTIPKMNRETKE